MPLVDLKTNLKDLKFGHDRYDGESSKEPYIQKKIPTTENSIQTLIGSGGPDFLLRGGLLLPNTLIDDTIRLSKFFISTKGILFTIKQNLLSRTGVRVQGAPTLLNEGIYTPLSTLAGAIGNPVGLHVNKQGLNPFLGFGDTFVPDRYISAISNEINEANQSGGADIASNRLVGLFSVKMLGDNASSRFFSLNSISNDDEILLSYGGGPGSILGIGKTHIRYATDNTDTPLSVTFKNKSLRSDSTLTFEQINEIASETSDGVLPGTKFRIPKPVDFRTKLKVQSKTIISKAPSYDPGNNKVLEQRVNLGDPGNANGKDLTSYTEGVLLGQASNNSYDKINVKSLYQSEAPDEKNTNDLVKFRIGVINNNTPTLKTYIHFRAFLNQISDTYNSIWEPTKYIGRGENLYTYTGFDRKVSLSWTVAAQSKVELIPMYKKLNYLASVITPDYSDSGYMRGNIVTLTIGGYFYEQPGIITGFNYEMNDDNDTWEIAINDEGTSDSSVKELPHLIRVTGFNFIPIHTFVPRLQQNDYREPNQEVLLDENRYGNEKYIGLSNGLNDNYIPLELQQMDSQGIQPLPINIPTDLIIPPNAGSVNSLPLSSQTGTPRFL